MLSGEALSDVPDSMRGLGNALLNCKSIADLRSHAPLPKDAQEMIDAAVIRVGLERLVIAGDIMAANTYSLPDPLSVMELYWERVAEIGDAQRTMLPGARGERQMPRRDGQRIPIYATADDFSLNIRTIRAAVRAGAPLDTFMVEQATRRVNESVEDATINGADLTVDGNSVPGLLNAPNVNTVSWSGSNPAWDHASKTGEEILTDALAMIDELQDSKRYGPYNLYIPTAYGNAINKDFKANSDKTIRQRLEEVDEISSVKVADQLPANRGIMLQMTSDVADMIVGQTPITVSWEDGPGWERFFVVLAFLIPRVRDDIDGNSGICTGNV
jgi:uncharacterized linocin/CFP29 family protein